MPPPSQARQMEGLEDAMRDLRGRHEAELARLRAREAELERELAEREEAVARMREERDRARVNPKAAREASELRRQLVERDALNGKLRAAIKDLEGRLRVLREEHATRLSQLVDKKADVDDAVDGRMKLVEDRVADMAREAMAKDKVRGWRGANSVMPCEGLAR